MHPFRKFMREIEAETFNVEFSPIMVKITPTNPKAVVMMGGRKILKESAGHPEIASLLARAEGASFMGSDGEPMSIADIKIEMEQMRQAANDY